MKTLGERRDGGSVRHCIVELPFSEYHMLQMAYKTVNTRHNCANRDNQEGWTRTFLAMRKLIQMYPALIGLGATIADDSQ